ncbi:MAG: ribosome small subunit-dependent GTPase A [Bacillota bacterium]
MTNGIISPQAGSPEVQAPGAFCNGLVVQAGNGVYRVLADGRAVICAVRGRLVKEARDMTGPVAPGDSVFVTLLGDGRGVIEEVHPRRNWFGRKAAGRRPGEQVIAANLDQVVIVFAAADPAFKERGLNRYLAVAEYSGIPAVICLNKADLVSFEDISGKISLYQDIGYQVLFTSARTGQGIDHLASVLANRISAVVGPSGVGKSSLLNAVEPGLGLATQEVSPTTHKGRHTTTASRLLPLSAGGYVVDTAGMREFGFWELPAEELAACFPEMRPFLGRCRFSDCVHISEPGCAIREAVGAGFISPRRYEHYAKLRREG